MSQIILTNRSLSPASLKNQCGLDISRISSLACLKPKTIIPNTLYLIDQNPSTDQKNKLSQLSTLPVSRVLTDLSFTFGGDNVIAFFRLAGVKI